MSWLSNLFGVKAERRKETQSGFYWQVPGEPALVAGRGWTQDVAGESFYRDALRRLTKGSTVHGVLMSQTAKLVAEEYDGEPSVWVLIEGQRVGSIPKKDAAAVHAELAKVAPGGVATAKAQISAGFEGGDYCVKLSLARPLRVRA
jgi:hypothetical protein